MKPYLGIPIQWDDGELFGTLCALSDLAHGMKPQYLDSSRNSARSSKATSAA